MNVYVVTRTFGDTKEGIRDIPNLGIHSSLKKATRHFESVLQDRALRGTVVWDRCFDTPIAYKVEIREALVEYTECSVKRSEHLVIEKWKLR